MNQIETEPRRRIAKPLGVYILVSVDFVIFGLLPLIGVILLSRLSGIELSFGVVILPVALAVISIAACVWAWIGDNPARYLLVGIITLSSLLTIANSFLVLADEDLASSQKFAPMPFKYVVRGAFWIGINCWYFFRPSTAAYYRQRTWS